MEILETDRLPSRRPGIVPHFVRETLDIIDRASIIHAGEVLFEGSPREIVDNPEVKRVYLGDSFSEPRLGVADRGRTAVGELHRRAPHDEAETT